MYEGYRFSRRHRMVQFGTRWTGLQSLAERLFKAHKSALAHMRERKQKLEGELRRLTETAAETGPSSFLVAAIHEREQQLREITDQLLTGGAYSVDAHLSEMRGFITKQLGDLQHLISGEPAEARKELVKHVSEIRMFPQDGSKDGTANRITLPRGFGVW